MAAWAALLGDRARADRPVVLAAPSRARRPPSPRPAIALPPGVRVVEPQGYRTSLALQLHAAAVLTDSGGVQREAAWLGVPCLVLRGTTEWVEAVAGSDGRMVVVGLDRARAASELARLAPAADARAIAERRAVELDLRPAGAAEAIVDALEADRA